MTEHAHSKRGQPLSLPDQHVEAQVELEAADEQGVVHVAARHQVAWAGRGWEWLGCCGLHT